MSSQKKQKRLILAYGFLAATLLAFGWSVFRYFMTDPTVVQPTEGAYADPDQEDLGAGANPGAAPAAEIRSDMLRRFGSYDAEQTATATFGAPAPEKSKESPDTPAPKVLETERATPTPTVEVTMILRTGAIHRAVVNSQIVRVGQRIPAGTIQSIDADAVSIDVGLKVVSYPLGAVAQPAPKSGGASAEASEEDTDFIPPPSPPSSDPSSLQSRSNLQSRKNL